LFSFISDREAILDQKWLPVTHLFIYFFTLIATVHAASTLP